MCHGDNAKTHFCDDCHHGTKVELGVRHQARRGSSSTRRPSPSRREGVHRAVPHAEVLRRLPHRRARSFPASHKQANWTQPQAPTRDRLRQEAGAAVSAKHALDGSEVHRVVRGLPRRRRHERHVLQELPQARDAAPGRVQEVPRRDRQEEPERVRELPPVQGAVQQLPPRRFVARRSRGSASTATSVNKNGAAGCFEKCHKKNDCVKCHTDAQGRAGLAQGEQLRAATAARRPAQHVQLYKKDARDLHLLPHGDAAKLPNSKFCKGCHKLDDAAPDGFGDEGKAQKVGAAPEAASRRRRSTRPVCANCHTTSFCNACHHEGAPAEQAVGQVPPDRREEGRRRRRASSATRRRSAPTAT